MAKLCPLKIGRDLDKIECSREKCALYIKVRKPITLGGGIVDPEEELVYEGCGLIKTIPWKLAKRRAKPLEAKTR